MISLSEIVVWFLSRFTTFLTAFMGLLVVGCASLNPTPPVEAFANRLADEVILPAVREGLARGVESLTIQAGAQGINPTYIIRFNGKWVVGIEGNASVGVEGISGQLQISSAAPSSDHGSGGQ